MLSVPPKLYEAGQLTQFAPTAHLPRREGISIPPVPADLGAEEQFSEAYVRINPRCVVPTLLLEDGTGYGSETTWGPRVTA
jgi:glutathione S-transferase